MWSNCSVGGISQITLWCLEFALGHWDTGTHNCCEALVCGWCYSRCLLGPQAWGGLWKRWCADLPHEHDQRRKWPSTSWNWMLLRIHLKNQRPDQRKGFLFGWKCVRRNGVSSRWSYPGHPCPAPSRLSPPPAEQHKNITQLSGHPCFWRLTAVKTGFYKGFVFLDNPHHPLVQLKWLIKWGDVS